MRSKYVTPETHKKIALASLPKSELQPNHFELQVAPVPTPGPGELLVQTLYLSLDAANRAWMQGPTYRAAVNAGDTMPSYTIGRVVQSEDKSIPIGSIVAFEGEWAEYITVKSDMVSIAPSIKPLSHAISVLGLAGKTAYHGLLSVGRPQEGETIVVSAAAGSVGTLVGQIGKIKGCRVVGIAGGPEKCAWLVDKLGFDEAVDYKSDSFFKDLKKACPKGIDVYFDNVGGTILETALFLMNMKGRVVCCGAVSQYETDKPHGPRNLPGMVVVKRLRMEGFIAFDFAEYDATAEKDLANWVADGRIQVVEDIVDGLENAPDALIGLLNGKNRGKRMVRVTSAE